MGRRFCPAKAIAPILRARRFIWLSFAPAFALSGAALLAGALPAAAQTPTGHETKNARGEAAKMFVEANELRYDTEKNIVSAEGNARIYYKDQTLEADRVVYDRNTGRVYAEGHAKLTLRDGTMLHGDRFDLTDDFRDGFIESLRAETPPKPYKNVLGGQLPGAPATTDATGTVTGTYKTYFSAPRAERIEGDTTVFDKGTYTACDACKDNPDKPPLWRVRAKRIIHKNDEKMIYYEDSSLEFLGIPIAYVPFFSAPDPSVTRKSGILSPYLATTSYAGVGVGIPIFWALAPDYDLTFTPTYYSQQGFFAKAEWRQRLESGEYYIRATGISEQNPTVFPLSPYGSGNQSLRGSFESKGQFYIADQWKFGWEFTLLSDKWYLNDYHVPSQNSFVELFQRDDLDGLSQRPRRSRLFRSARLFFRGPVEPRLSAAAANRASRVGLQQDLRHRPRQVFRHRRSGRTRLQSDQSFGEFGELPSGRAAGVGQCLWSL